MWRKAEKNRKSSNQTLSNPHVPTHLVGGPDNTISSKKSPSNHLRINDNDQNSNETSNQENDAFEAEKDDSKMGLFTRESPISGNFLFWN